MNKRIFIFSLLASFLFALPGHSQLELPSQKLVEGALADIEGKKYDEALLKLGEAEKINPNSAFIFNLMGAAYTKKKDYVTAQTNFDKALSLDPQFFPSLFNVGELIFLQTQYPQALSYFSKLLSQDPGNELLQFKVILCLLMTDQTEEAEKQIKRMKYPGDGPAWYYAQAAVKIKQGDKREAGKILAGAKTIFPNKISLYEETFQDLGWQTR